MPFLLAFPHLRKAYLRFDFNKNHSVLIKVATTSMEDDFSLILKPLTHYYAYIYNADTPLSYVKSCYIKPNYFYGIFYHKMITYYMLHCLLAKCYIFSMSIGKKKANYITWGTVGSVLHCQNCKQSCTLMKYIFPLSIFLGVKKKKQRKMPASAACKNCCFKHQFMLSFQFLE